MTDASDDVSNISRNSNSDSDSNIADNNNDINLLKENIKRFGGEYRSID